jgi:hypothetical protein
MSYFNFNFYNTFNFNNNVIVFAFQVAITVVNEEKSNNQGRRNSNGCNAA